MPTIDDKAWIKVMEDLCATIDINKPTPVCPNPSEHLAFLIEEMREVMSARDYAAWIKRVQQRRGANV